MSKPNDGAPAPKNDPPAPAEPNPAPAAPEAPNPAPPPMAPEELEALREAQRNWSAVSTLFRKGEDGRLEIDPEALPAAPSRSTEEDDEARRAAEADARRRQEIEQTAARTSAAYAERVSKDLDIQQTLRQELVSEPGGEEIFNVAKVTMQKVPIEQRSEKAWRNAIIYGRGATESKRREHWIAEGRKKQEEDLSKNFGIRVPKPAGPAKTEEEMVADLSPEQKRAADASGISYVKYAQNLAKLKGAGR